MPRKHRFGSSHSDKRQAEWERRTTWTPLVLSAPDMLPIAYFLLLLASIAPHNQSMVEAKKTSKESKAIKATPSAYSVKPTAVPAYTSEGKLYGQTQTFFDQQPHLKIKEMACEGDICQAGEDNLPMRALAAKIKQKISFTETAYEKYHYRQAHIEQAILHTAKTKDGFCKLRSLLDAANTGFEFKVYSDQELDKNKSNQSITMGVYDHNINQVKLRASTIYSSFFQSILIHEIHHAFVNYQNRNANFVFYLPDALERVPNSFPCSPINERPGMLDCAHIGRIIVRGVQTVETFLELLDHKDHTTLSSSQQTLLANYLVASEQYAPVLIDVDIDDSTINNAIAKGVLNKDLHFTNSDQYLTLIQEVGSKEEMRYTYKIIYQDGHYIAQTRSCTKQDAKKAPLLDIKYGINFFIDPSLDLAHTITEIDAVIFQMFTQTPALLDLLFPGLREYHLERSEDKYRRCVN